MRFFIILITLFCIFLLGYYLLKTKNEKIMYHWIESLTTCPKADSSRYPKPNTDALALFKKAAEADNANPKTMPQEEIVKLYQKSANFYRSHAPALDLIHKSDQARNVVIPAGIAGIQKPWRANSSISKCLILVISSPQFHLPVDWIPAIPAGMTCPQHLCITMSAERGNDTIFKRICEAWKSLCTAFSSLKYTQINDIMLTLQVS